MNSPFWSRKKTTGCLFPDSMEETKQAKHFVGLMGPLVKLGMWKPADHSSPVVNGGSGEGSNGCIHIPY